MALNLLSLYTLIFALFDKTHGMIDSLKIMEDMKNLGTNFGLDTQAPTLESPKDCYTIPMSCELLEKWVHIGFIWPRTTNSSSPWFGLFR